jgi:hypothetical protein
MSSSTSISLTVLWCSMTQANSLFFQAVRIQYILTFNKWFWVYHFLINHELIYWPCTWLFADVAEGSFIIYSHTPMSNLFSWFNEDNRFTSHNQLSFTYTYLKLKGINPGKPFHLNIFKVIPTLRFHSICTTKFGLLSLQSLSLFLSVTEGCNPCTWIFIPCQCIVLLNCVYLYGL